MSDLPICYDCLMAVSNPIDFAASDSLLTTFEVFADHSGHFRMDLYLSQYLVTFLSQILDVLKIF